MASANLILSEWSAPWYCPRIFTIFLIMIIDIDKAPPLALGKWVLRMTLGCTHVSTIIILKGGQLQIVLNSALTGIM